MCNSLNLKISWCGGMPPDPPRRPCPADCVDLQLYHDLFTPLFAISRFAWTQI